LDSDKFDTKKERIETLKNEIKSNSDFDNTEFELFNVNGFTNTRTLVPGASSWDYKFVIRVKVSDINKWTEGWIRIKSTDNDLSWTNEIIKKRANEWITISQPEFYTRKGNDVLMIVFRNEGIIYKRVITK
jgi:hypothetical protein